MRFERKRGQNEKKHILDLKKQLFFTGFFLAGPLALHFQDDL
jgi:hypothetical protein